MREIGIELDYPVRECVDIASREELVEAFRAREGEPVRLIGGGSSQQCLPPPRRTPTLLRLAPMDALQRLEPDDLTCSVEPGLDRRDLDAALEEHGLWLPCAGTGTMGGLLAADLHAPMAPGGWSARSVLLGFEGVLAEGLPFKSGARVVKSVAGFDLQKAFVGSRGRLFAATLLHLKLRPRPRVLQAFERRGLDLEGALSIFGALRALPSPPHELWLERAAGDHTVRGALAGHPGHVADTVRERELREVGDAGARRLTPEPNSEIVCGQVRPSRLPQLLAILPESAPLLVGGTGQFEALLRPGDTDDVLREAADLRAATVVRSGAPPRRGLTTATDPAVARLTAGLEAALDPKRMLQ